ncbi:hypothetical protein B0H12DRAFT_1172467 [Mycena haematopus]|nr:hypothetical protein B0H12DRAFT_1172467 [Mycena haematopus]
MKTRRKRAEDSLLLRLPCAFHRVSQAAYRAVSAFRRVDPGLVFSARSLSLCEGGNVLG